MVRIPLIVTGWAGSNQWDSLFKHEVTIMDIKDTNFVTIQGWMRTKLNLKGNELLAYAVIYGFSQTDGAKFTGSRKYLAEWCGCSLATIDRTLDSLVNKGLITKTAYITPHGYRAVEYAAIMAIPATPTTPAAPTDQTPWSDPTDTAATQSQTTDDEPQPILNEPQSPTQPKDPDPSEEVIDHLNSRAGTRYKATTANTRKLIKARLREGFTVEDMKLVIDKKCADWLNNQDMAQYLRPETLFGNKFESYLNAKSRPQTSQNNMTQRQNIDPAAAAYLEANAKYLTNDKGWF